MAETTADSDPVLGDTPTVLAAWFCPFAQRTLIAFHAKSKPAAKFTIHEITHNDLYSKPSWFTDLNPAGLIPVIAWKPTDSADLALAGTAAACAIDGVLSIKESLICNEYIEDAYPEPPLLPTSPAGRAAARLIIQRFSDKFVPAYYKILVLQDEAGRAAAAKTLDTELTWLVEQLSPTGPLALSDQLSLVDCAVVPFFLRLYILEHYRGYAGHKQGTVTERLQRYMQAAEQHPAVAATLHHPDGLDYKEALLASYARYADGSANSLMAREAKSKE